MTTAALVTLAVTLSAILVVRCMLRDRPIRLGSVRPTHPALERLVSNSHPGDQP